MAKRPTVISLYSGAGGLDYGFEAAGFDTAVAVEMNHDCCVTLRMNRPEWAILQGDIHKFSSEHILEAGRLKKGAADVLIGGPPCQPFSKSGYWASGDSKRLEDSRASTLWEYVRVVEQTLPKVFLLENVHGLSYANKAEGLEMLLDEIRAINKRTGSHYEPSFQVLKAVEYGVPQQRERFVLVASRDGTEFRFPAPTHRGPDDDEQGSLLEDSREPYMTAWDALHDVAPSEEELASLAVAGKWADLLPSIPEGENYLYHTERRISEGGKGKPLFGWRRHFWCFLLKLAKNRPSWTVQAQPGPATGPFHWDNRRLSARELCRIQTFPDDVKIYGPLSSIQKQVGNAVPSLLAETLARGIRAQFSGLIAIREPPLLLPKREKRIPRPQAAASVPRKYLHLQGAHSAHPGTGRGNGALKRTATNAVAAE
jgi:DNA (cytosine-5)-methyltransferase 1